MAPTAASSLPGTRLTSFVKHGGISAQEADTAAAGIASLVGVGDRPPGLDLVVRGMLLTGKQPLYLTARVVAGLGWRSEVYQQPPWPADEKVAAEELGPYLAHLDTATEPPCDQATVNP